MTNHGRREKAVLPSALNLRVLTYNFPVFPKSMSFVPANWSAFAPDVEKEGKALLMLPRAPIRMTIHDKAGAEIVDFPAGFLQC